MTAATVYAPSITSFVEQLTVLIRDGWTLDATIMTEECGTLFQPAAIAHRASDNDLQIVRLNAFTEATHYAKRTAARAAAETYIEFARADA